MTFFIESLGCAKNQVDSEYLIADLEARGLRWVAIPEEAQIIIVNTCGFITSAKDQSIQTSLSLKNRFPEKKVIMLGCLVQRYAAELETEMGEIDGFVGLNDPDALWRLLSSGGGHSGIGETARPWMGSRRRFLSFPGSAYVKVAEGCSNHCSYCAIPLIRGELVSRPAGEILEEIEELLRRGVFEIVLIAQDLASYGQDRGRRELVALVKSILRLEQQFWLRLLYLHPDHFPTELLDVVAADPRLLPYFDIPFQHASRPVLAKMGRSGSAARYAREEGTVAYKLAGGVKKTVAEARKRAVEQVQIGISERLLDRKVGQDLDVLVEERVQGERMYLGRGYLHAPEVDGLVVVKADRLEPGRIYPVRIDGRAGIDLEAVLV
jgi:ribosomal protein S12 methylthiotransferase